MKYAVSEQFFFNNRIQNFMKIRPLIAEFFHADRRVDGLTDLTNLMVAFRNFVNVPNIFGNFCILLGLHKTLHFASLIGTHLY